MMRQFYFFRTILFIFLTFFVLEQQHQMPLYFLRSINIKSSTAEKKWPHLWGDWRPQFTLHTLPYIH